MLTLLKAARKVGTVHILTQADMLWVNQSMTSLKVGGIDIQEVFRDLEIKFHYADLEKAKETRLPSGVDVLTMAKMIPMQKILKARFGDDTKSVWNVLSIGDRPTELLALKELCKDHAKKVWRRPICKTVKLKEEPMLEDLSETCELLTKHIARLAASESDFEITQALLATVSVDG